MASQSIRRQSTICALLEGFLNMMSDQGADKSEMFKTLRTDAIKACDEAVELLRAEPNGRLSDRDIVRIKRAIDLFHDRCFPGGEFTAEEPLSMLICLIVDQLSFMKPGAKQRAFEKLLHETENLMVCFDPACEYSAPDGYRAAVVFEALEI